MTGKYQVISAVVRFTVMMCHVFMCVSSYRYFARTSDTGYKEQDSPEGIGMKPSMVNLRSGISLYGSMLEPRLKSWPYGQ